MLERKLLDLLQNKEIADIFLAKQEYNGKKDQYGRFIYEFSNNKEALTPVVSNYLIKKGFFEVFWPERHSFAACLTHDVDTIYPTWKYTFFTSTKLAIQLKMNQSITRLAGKMKSDNTRNPFWNFKSILALEAQYGGKSSFYFKTTDRDIVDFIYDIEELTAELGNIVDLGGEVGLHGGFYSFEDPIALKKEKDRLEQSLRREVIGIRMHYLRFQVPDTWNLLSNLGFKYDTTFGYADSPGFRNGMAHPFKPYSLTTKKEIDILEIPLVLMDGTLFSMSPNEAWDVIKNLVEVTEKCQGVITILWHNHILDQAYWGSWTKMYEKILNLLKEKNAWITSAEEVHKYWSTHIVRSAH